MHDFKTQPELMNSQMQLYYFQSPHKQITESFWAHVEKVHDGDTITVSCDFRNFNFPIRFAGMDAPELSTGDPGKESKYWLKDKIENEDVFIEINPRNRVGKFGRLIGNIIFNGMSINEQSMRERQSTSFRMKGVGKIPSLNKLIRRAFQ